MRQKKALLFFVPIRRPLTHPLTHRKRAFTPPRQEWVILEDEATTKTDAGESAIALVDRYVTGSASLARAKPSEGGTLMFQFESVDGGTVFNPDALRLMKEIDDIIMDVPGYEDFCQLAYDGTADDANSLGCVHARLPHASLFPVDDDVRQRYRRLSPRRRRRARLRRRRGRSSIRGRPSHVRVLPRR